MEPEAFEVQIYINREIARLEQIRAEDQKALLLAAKEYERRLESLNHAHEKAEADRSQFLTNIAYDVAHREIRSLIETQRVATEKAANLAEVNARDIARLTNTLTWITRTVIGAILVIVVGVMLRGTPLLPVVP